MVLRVPRPLLVVCRGWSQCTSVWTTFLWLLTYGEVSSSRYESPGPIRPFQGKRSRTICSTIAFIHFGSVLSAVLRTVLSIALHGNSGTVPYSTVQYNTTIQYYKTVPSCPVLSPANQGRPSATSCHRQKESQASSPLPGMPPWF
jgi:hypothetical protein